MHKWASLRLVNMMKIEIIMPTLNDDALASPKQQQ